MNPNSKQQSILESSHDEQYFDHGDLQFLSTFLETSLPSQKQFNRMTLDDLLDYVYSHYPKQAMRSALNRNVVDDYFEDFWNTNELNDEYFVNAARAIRAKQ